jgi:hypothetical protein
MVRTPSFRNVVASLAPFAAVASTRLNAQAPAGETGAPAPSAEANNPLAKFQAFNVHDYYVPSISESDQNANTFWSRYAQPFGKFLFRASLPVSRVPAGGGTTTSGLSDLNAFAAYLFDTGDPSVSLGAGPQVTIPTAPASRSPRSSWASKRSS